MVSGLLVTGASGFVGRALVSFLADRGDWRVVAAVRHKSDELPAGVQQIDGLNAGPDTDWRQALDGIACVIHLAAVSPASLPAGADDCAYRRVNVDGSLNLARQAASAGVGRFVFVSSIGVNGPASDKPFTPSDKPMPANPYAVSKHRAEAGLKAVFGESSTQVAIIRPPLIYGPNVAGKFETLLRALAKGWPLPLGAVDNRRSYVALHNLVDLIAVCASHPQAADETFLASDGEDLSTTDLLRRTGQALAKPARLLPLPAWSLTFIATALGQREAAQALCGNLQVDISHTCNTLGWKPPVSVDQALNDTANAFSASMPEPAAITGKTGRLLRLFDVVLSLLGLVAGSPVLLALLAAASLDTGSPLFRQQRIGRGQQPFLLVKFRTMALGTASAATHEVDTAAVTRLGRFMRKMKLDELPQLWNVLKGEMSLVGPRPGLLIQTELTEERARRGVFCTRPGITGLAQIKGIDMATPGLLAETDRQMLNSLTVGSYFKYIVATVTGKGGGDAIGKA